MSIHKIKEKFLVFKGSKKPEHKFRSELSKQIIKKFGKGPFLEEKETQEIIVFSLDYYINEFEKICQSETSVLFYQNIFLLHEQSVELALLHNEFDLSPEINRNYLASYRRILKFILEQACEVPLKTGTSPSKEFKNHVESVLDDLLFLGNMILTCVSLYSEQSMIEDVAEITFEKGLYVFSRKHHYDFIFDHIIEVSKGSLTKTIVDKSELSGLSDLYKALEDYLGVNYKNVGHLIASIHNELESKGGESVGVGWETLTINLKELFNVPLEKSELFFQGLRLDKNNKMDLKELACKPYKLNRYLYRPIIIWNIDGKDYALFGKNSWTEAFIQLATNSIPWGKAPVEWMKKGLFKKYVHKKEDKHDKWLEDEVELVLKEDGYKYDRNLTSIHSLNGPINIETKDLGEIDFIVISEEAKKIFIIDCKHLLGRYDAVNQRNDFNAFSKGSKKNKSYNKTMENKLNWLETKKEDIQNHFREKYSDKTDILDYKIEGIFIINTPTLYMYNATYRIYAINQVRDVLSNNFSDPTFNVIIDDVDTEKFISVKYPYFKKPEFIVLDLKD